MAFYSLVFNPCHESPISKSKTQTGKKEIVRNFFSFFSMWCNKKKSFVISFLFFQSGAIKRNRS